MAIAFDNSTADSHGYTNSLTFSHTVAGTDRLLLVGASARGESVTGMTYNGTSMTLLEAANPGNIETTLYYLIAPDTGANNVVITCSGPGSVAAVALSLTGVHQTTTFGTQSEATAGAESLSTSVSSATDELCVDIIGLRSDSVMSADSGQTERDQANEGTRCGAAMSTEPGASSVTIGWSWSGSVNSAIIAVPVKPSAAGGSSILPIKLNQTKRISSQGVYRNLTYTVPKTRFMMVEYTAPVDTEINTNLSTVVITAFDPEIEVGTEFDIALSTVTVTKYNPEIEVGTIINATSGQILITKHNPEIEAGIEFNVTLPTVTITKYNPEIEVGTEFDVGLSTVTVTKYNPEIEVGTTINSGLETIQITSYNPNITIDSGTIEAQTGTVAITAYAVSMSIGINIEIDLSTIIVTAYNTEIPTTIDVESNNISLISYTPDILVGTTIGSGLGTISIVSYNPEVETGITIDCAIQTVIIQKYNVEIIAATSIESTVGTVAITSYNLSFGEYTSIDVTTGVVIILPFDTWIFSPGDAPESRIMEMTATSRIITKTVSSRTLTKAVTERLTTI